MWDQVLSLLQNLSLTQWAGVGVLALLAYRNWDMLAGGVSWVTGLAKKAVATTTTTTPTDRKHAITAYDDCIVYLQSIGCDDGVEHLKKGLQHFYYQKEE